MRLCTALDLMGLQAVRQGQITNNWLKRGPDYWLRKIEDKQLFPCLPRRPPPGLRHTAESLLYLWWSMGKTPGPLLQDLLSSFCLCSVTAFHQIHWIFLFSSFWCARQQFLSKRDSHPLTLTKGQPGFVSISMSSRQEGVTATKTTFTLQHKVQYWLDSPQWINSVELQKRKKKEWLVVKQHFGHNSDECQSQSRAFLTCISVHKLSVWWMQLYLFPLCSEHYTSCNLCDINNEM